MAELENPTRSTSFQMGWWILFVITVILTLWHTVLLFAIPGEDLPFIVTIALNTISAVVLYIPYQRDEKWAWYAIWAMVVPYALAIFFASELGYYLGIATLMALGQSLTWETIFSRG